MMHVTILLPVKYNDGSVIQPTCIDTCLEELRHITGGYTLEGLCYGAYTMNNGDVVYDQCHKVWVTCESDCCLQKLRQWARNVARMCRQETLYFEFTPTTVEFIKP